MTIFKMEEECSKQHRMQDPGEASTKLKKRERGEASKLNPKLLSLIAAWFLAERETMALSLLEDPKLAGLILQTLSLKSSREATVISLSLLRRLDTSRFL
jgi:hypothetical protein